MNTDVNPPQSRARKNLRFALRVAALLVKGFGALASFVAVLLIAAYFALPYVVDGEQAKAVIQAQLQLVLHRPVRIQRVFVTPQGVKLSGLRVFEPDGATPFIEGDFALVTVKLQPLLDKHRLELSNVRLASPRIHVTRDASGRWSFADIFTSTAPAGQQATKSFGMPVTLAADQTAIESGRLEVDDQLRGRHFVVDRFNLSIRQFDLSAPFTYSLSFDNAVNLGRSTVTASVALSGQASLAGFDWDQGWLAAERAVVRIDGRPVRGSFMARGLPPASLDAVVRLPELGPDDWQRWLGKTWEFNLPASEWRTKVHWFAPGKLAVDSLTAKAGSLAGQASGAVDLNGAQPQITADLAVEEFPLEQAADFEPALKRFSLRGTVRGEVSLSGAPGHWAVAKTHARFDGLEAGFAHWRVIGGSADLTARRDFEELAVTLSSGAIRAYGNDFGDITSAFHLAKRNLDVDYLSFKWDVSHVRARGRIANLPDPHDVAISGVVDRVRWEKAQPLAESILDSIAPSTQTVSGPQPEAESAKQLWVQTFKYAIPQHFPDTMGHLKIGKVTHKNFSFGDMDLLWDLHGVTPQLNTVNGEIRVGFGPGRVEDIEAVQESHKFLNIVFLPYIYMHRMNSLSQLSAATAYPKTLDFTRIEGQYGIHQGVVTTRFSDVDSPQLIAFTDGTADFGQEKVDMNILTRLTSYRAPLPEWWVDEMGRPAIGFRVKGDLNNPDLEPRLHKIGAHEIEDTMADARGRGKARFEALAKLQQLEGRPIKRPTLPAPAQTPAPAVAEKDKTKETKKE